MDEAASEGQFRLACEAVLDRGTCMRGSDASAVGGAVLGVEGWQVPEPGVGYDEEVSQVEHGRGNLIGEASSAQDDRPGTGEFVQAAP